MGHNLTRKIGGETYYFDTQHHNQLRANDRAAKLRFKGERARVIQVDNLTWEVYKR